MTETPHRLRDRVKRFVLPKFTWKFGLRVAAVVVTAVLFFRFVCIPVRIEGRSMAPTYRHGQFTFCWTPAYWFRAPERGDVVTIRFSGKDIMLLKRVVATAGDRVAIRRGVLYVNGERQSEPYVQNRSDNWKLPPREVKPGRVYVIGDNRGMPMGTHRFGAVSVERVTGVPLW